MNPSANIELTWIDRPTAAAIACAATLYALFYFVLLSMPIVAVPTFRVDYMAATVTRGDELSDFFSALTHSRPVSGLFATVIGAATSLVGGRPEYVIYPLQHLALLVYFVLIAKSIEWILKIKIGAIPFLLAWLLFISTPAAMEGTYKLETIVGTLSMLFGGISLVMLARWTATRSIWSAYGFLGFYALSVFAKEDFILPPLFLLGWHINSAQDLKRGVAQSKWLLAGLLGILVFFLLFNKLLIEERTFIAPDVRPGTPYFMTLDPASIFKVLYGYSFGLGPAIQLIGLLFLATSVAALSAGKKWKETLLVALVVAGLMAPYAIMPNHVFAYYSLKWLAWQVLFSVAMLQLLSPSRLVAYTAVCTVSLALLAPILLRLHQHNDTLSHQSNYLRAHFVLSENIYGTLKKYRDQINGYERVAVVGIGPKQIVHTPWLNNGEIAFYLKGDLRLKPDWVVLVDSSGPGYVAGTPVRHDRGVTVEVREAAGFDDRRVPLLIFGKDGVGRFVDSGTRTGG